MMVFVVVGIIIRRKCISQCLYRWLYKKKKKKRFDISVMEEQEKRYPCHCVSSTECLKASLILNFGILSFSPISISPFLVIHLNAHLNTSTNDCTIGLARAGTVTPKPYTAIMKVQKKLKKKTKEKKKRMRHQGKRAWCGGISEASCLTTLGPLYHPLLSSLDFPSFLIPFPSITLS